MTLAQKRLKHEKVVSAEEFRLVDKRGNPLATFAPGPKAKPNLVFFEDGKPRITFGISETGEPFLWFFDANGKCRASIDLVEKGEPIVSINGKDGESHAALKTEALTGGEPSFELTDRSGRVRTWCGLLNGVPVFALRDKEGTPIIMIYEGELAEPSLRMRDSNGTIRISLGMGDQKPGLVLYDENAEPILLMMQPNGGGRLAVLKGGKTQWTVP